MKNIASILIFMLGAGIAQSQSRAITELGDTIYVYDNGTWSFELLDEMPEIANEFSYLDIELKIDTLDTAFMVPKASNKSLINERNQFSIRYDESLWKRVPPATLNDEAEFALEAKTSDVWCIVISEETPIDVDKLFKIAKQTMKDNTGDEAEVLKAELRTVNEHQVIRGTLRANFSGINFVFDSYYFSNEFGSVQFTTWTSDTLWEKNQAMILDLLNGFVVIQ